MFLSRPLKCAFLFLLLLCACGKKEEETVQIPPGILSPEQFSKVLKDFTLAESAANINIKNAAIQKMDSTYAFDPLKENHVSKTQYDSSVMFYVNHPTLYKKVYEAVLDSLSGMQAERDPSKKDSTLK